MVTIRELEKLGIFKNVYEDALNMSFGAKNPGMALIHVCIILLLKEILFEVTEHSSFSCQISTIHKLFIKFTIHNHRFINTCTAVFNLD